MAGGVEVLNIRGHRSGRLCSPYHEIRRYEDTKVLRTKSNPFQGSITDFECRAQHDVKQPWQLSKRTLISVGSVQVCLNLQSGHEALINFSSPYDPFIALQVQGAFGGGHVLTACVVAGN